MKKITIILVCLMMMATLVACGKEAKPEGEPAKSEENIVKSEEIAETTEKDIIEPEGDILMLVTSLPSPLTVHYLSNDSEEKVQELYKEYTDDYTIYSSGDVCYRNKLVRIKAEDLEAILEYYDRFCKNNVSIETGVICDLGGTYITVFGEENRSYQYEYSSNRRCQEVSGVESIVYPYFEHPSMWTVVEVEDEDVEYTSDRKSSEE